MPDALIGHEFKVVPANTLAGTLRVICECGGFEFEGDAQQCTDAGLGHVVAVLRRRRETRVMQARKIGMAILAWCDEDEASPVTLGALSGALASLCRTWHDERSPDARRIRLARAERQRGAEQ